MDKHNDNQHLNKRREYVKLALVLVFILGFSVLLSSGTGFGAKLLFENFMGVFFLVFAGFKIYSLKQFAHGFQDYDIIARKSLLYAYCYPFMQVLFGALYLFGTPGFMLNSVVLVVSIISATGVYKALHAKQILHCVCLGSVVKLPLSTVSFIEDFGMAIMAIVMLVLN